MRRILFLLLLSVLSQKNAFSLNTDKADIEKRTQNAEICTRIPAQIELAAYYFIVFGNDQIADSLCQIAINKSEEADDKILILKSYIAYSTYCKTTNYADAEAFLKKGINIAENKHLDEYLFQIHIQLACLKNLESKNDEALKWLLSSRAFIHNDDDKEYQYYLTMGDIYYETTDIQTAFDNYNRTMEFAYKINEPEKIVEANEKMIKFCAKNRLYSRGEECLENIKEVLQKKDIFSTYDKLYFKTIELEFMSKAEPKSLLEKGLALIKESHDNGFVVLESSVYGSLRMNFMNTNNIKSLCALYCDKEHESQLLDIQKNRPDLYYRIQALIYENNGEIDSAQVYWDYSESLISMIKQSAYVCNFFIRKGQFFQRQNKPQLALIAFKKAYQNALKANYLPMVIETTSLLDSVYYQLGDLPNAYRALKSNKFFADSNANILQQEKLFMLQQNASRKLEEIKSETESKAEEQKYRLQLYIIGFIILVFMYTLFILSKKAISIEFFKMFGYITVIFFFEFILFLLHNKFHQLTHSPYLLMLMNVTIIAILLPIHHATEHKLIHYLIKKNRIEKREFSIKQTIIDLVKKYQNWLHTESD